MPAAPILDGTTLPDVSHWSDRVTVALGKNPSPFTGPGTNTYLIGTGPERLLLDPGEGAPEYLPVLERAMREVGCRAIREIVLTHGHPDHMGGVAGVLERFGPLPVSKLPWPEVDARAPFPIEALAPGQRIACPGATLRALHTPGHAPDHLCFLLEEEAALISGDNVLGVGTTVIPAETGDLGDYLRSLEQMGRALRQAGGGRIYPAHGPFIEDGPGKIDAYRAHRREREQQILEALGAGDRDVQTIVRRVYAAYPRKLWPAAGQSVTQHLRALERTGRVLREGGADPEHARWRLP